MRATPEPAPDRRVPPDAREPLVDRHHPRHRLGAGATLVIGWLLVWAAPLAGLAAAGRDVMPYLTFPPRTAPVEQAAFSWPMFFLLSIPVLAAAALYGVALAAARRRGVGGPETNKRRKPFPVWGWLGIALVAAGWFLAWSAFVAPEWRRHTFTPLWLGYVLVMNALAYRRSGRALLTERTGLLLALFPASALFWWLFEHLNRFVGNWYYTGTTATGGWDYFLQATLPFSSVLPAVASTWAWLATFPRFDAMGESLSFRFSFRLCFGNRAWGAASLIAGVAGLACMGVWPQALFSLLWLAPLAVFLGLQKLLVGETLLAPLARGDWRTLLQPAAAALVCGFFWELWNWGSLAQWHYSVPYVQRFHVFEMPLLGYAGYLPFGVECAVAIDLVQRSLSREARRPNSDANFV
jgi:hypothetical protein